MTFTNDRCETFAGDTSEGIDEIRRQYEQREDDRRIGMALMKSGTTVAQMFAACEGEAPRRTFLHRPPAPSRQIAAAAKSRGAIDAFRRVARDGLNNGMFTSDHELASAFASDDAAKYPPSPKQIAGRAQAARNLARDDSEAAGRVAQDHDNALGENNDINPNAPAAPFGAGNGSGKTSQASAVVAALGAMAGGLGTLNGMPDPNLDTGALVQSAQAKQRKWQDNIDNDTSDASGEEFRAALAEMFGVDASEYSPVFQANE